LGLLFLEARMGKLFPNKSLLYPSKLYRISNSQL
jgi:hypothetical protein